MNNDARQIVMDAIKLIEDRVKNGAEMTSSEQAIECAYDILEKAGVPNDILDRLTEYGVMGK